MQFSPKLLAVSLNSPHWGYKWLTKLDAPLLWQNFFNSPIFKKEKALVSECFSFWLCYGPFLTLNAPHAVSHPKTKSEFSEFSNLCCCRLNLGLSQEFFFFF